MELTQENIDALVVNEVDIMKRIAEEMNIRMQQVSAVISLINEGCTIPFISRYRKEQHGSLDEVQVRDVDHSFKSYVNLETRRLEIIRGIFAAGKLSEPLYEAVRSARTLTELEDLWAPFKKKKKTRGMIAAEKGLEPLADAMTQLDDSAIEAKAAEFVHENTENPDLSVASVQDALAGAVEGVDVRHLDLEDLFDSLLDLHLVRVRGHHEGVLAAIGQGIALLGDDGLEDDVVGGLVNSDHGDQASLALDSPFASRNASKPSFEKTTYWAVTTSYVFS